MQIYLDQFLDGLGHSAVMVLDNARITMSVGKTVNGGAKIAVAIIQIKDLDVELICGPEQIKEIEDDGLALVMCGCPGEAGPDILYDWSVRQFLKHVNIVQFKNWIKNKENKAWRDGRNSMRNALKDLLQID